MSCFDDWWKVYPIKKAKKLCRQLWERENCEALAEQMIEHVQLMLEKDKLWKVGIGIPHPSTYIRQERWEDEPEIEQERQTSELPADTNLWHSFCIERGIKPPRPGELVWQAKQRIESELTRRH